MVIPSLGRIVFFPKGVRQERFKARIDADIKPDIPGLYYLYNVLFLGLSGDDDPPMALLELHCYGLGFSFDFPVTVNREIAHLREDGACRF